MRAAASALRAASDFIEEESEGRDETDSLAPLTVPSPASPASPLWQELSWSDPAELFSHFSGEPYALFLDGAADARAPISYIALRPTKIIRAAIGENGPEEGGPEENGSQENGPKPDPLAAIAATGLTRSKPLPDLPPFQAGWAGFLAYEAGGFFEKLPMPKARPAPLPDFVFAHYDCIFAFDHGLRRCGLFTATLAQRLAILADLRAPISAVKPPACGPAQSLMPDADYEKAVEKVRDYIFAGDIYQANLARAFRIPVVAPGDDYALYLALRARHPATNGAFYRLPEGTILSLSPELFLTLEDGTVTTRPIKGTARRKAHPAEDAAAAIALQESAKDRAENLMIVDLLRNDLARMAAPGTVAVPQLCALEQTPLLHHLVSTVVGHLQEGNDALSVLRATFPGGSITGAPKIRAQEIIRALEPLARGAYCGALGYLARGETGLDAMRLNILIRTLIRAPDHYLLQTGAGIVADSDPVQENMETHAKAEGILSALAALQET